MCLMPSEPIPACCAVAGATHSADRTEGRHPEASCRRCPAAAAARAADGSGAPGVGSQRATGIAGAESCAAEEASGGLWHQ